MRKTFLENKYERKIKVGESQRLEKYHNEVYKKGDLVYYQDGTKKDWCGPVKILEQVSNSEVKLDIPEANSGYKRIHKY